MKLFRYFFLILLCYVVITVFFNFSNQSEIITVEHNYIQNIKDNEVIRIPFLVSSLDIPLVDKELISKVSIINDDYLIPVTLKQIKCEKYVVNYQNKNYHAVMFDITLNQANPKIQMPKASIKITYLDDTSATYYLGNFFMKYGKLKDINVFFMDSQANYLDDYYTVTKLLIGVENKSDKPLLIKNFYLDNDDIFIDNDNIQVFDEKVDLSLEAPELLYNEVIKSNLDYQLQAHEKKYFLLPLKYLKKTYLFRFYITINTKDNINTIDDFVFLNQGYFPYFAFDNKHVYTNS